MARMSDRDRILNFLADSDGLSSQLVKTELNLSSDRYDSVIGELIADKLVEKYRCRGGGIRLTKKGENAKTEQIEAISSVGKESQLYDPFVKFLRSAAEENEALDVICPTHALRARGKWQNPDVTRISIEHYRYLRRFRIHVTTYEVKQFPRWDVGAVFEAASHHRFSHQSYVVLEWPKKEILPFSLADATYRVDQIARECQRHGVGLATIEPHYSSYRFHERLAPKPILPTDADVDAWLDYVFSRLDTSRSEFEEAIETAQNLGETVAK